MPPSTDRNDRVSSGVACSTRNSGICSFDDAAGIVFAMCAISRVREHLVLIARGDAC
jgi:hypothetical protein